MVRDEALSLVTALLAPMPVELFFADVFGRRMGTVDGDAAHPRAALLGPDPAATVLAAYATHAERFGIHADGADGPPPARGPVADAAGFARLVAAHHARGYTVHVPDVAVLSPPLARLARAFELLLRQPARTSLFWSRPGNRAPVHYDDRDNIVVHLSGAKRWYVSSAAPSLHNPWRDPAEGQPPLGPHHVIDMAPGRLLFLPRGLPHTVETSAESLHLSITLLPLTVRDAMVAALDHLSDQDRALRQTAPDRADRADEEAERIGEAVAAGLERLAAACRRPGFVAAALERRASRMIGDLPRLPAGPVPPTLSPASRLAHAPEAVGLPLTGQAGVDFAMPGMHLNVHAAAEAALRFVAATPRFRLAEVPGLNDELRVALAARLLESGFLVAAD